MSLGGRGVPACWHLWTLCAGRMDFQGQPGLHFLLHASQAAHHRVVIPGRTLIFPNPGFLLWMTGMITQGFLSIVNSMANTWDPVPWASRTSSLYSHGNSFILLLSLPVPQDIFSQGCLWE